MAGPGTELMSLLANIGITGQQGCNCKTHADKMDRLSADWCEENIEEPVDWLMYEADKQGWNLFVASENDQLATTIGITLNWLAEHTPETVIRGIARLLILTAIRRSRQ